MDYANTLELLKAEFGAAIVGAELEVPDPWVEITVESLPAVCRFVKKEPTLQLDMLNCITAVDYFHTDPKKAAKADWEPHLELVYHLTSISKKHSLVLKLKTSRWKDDVEGQLPDVPSVADIWRTADWHEREVFDLSGICFVGHPDPRRILCPEDWVGHPLRKDYEMPNEYHGIRGR